MTTPTEQSLIRELPDDVRDAWDKLKQFLMAAGPQRSYASETAIMFARRVVYVFVRPQRAALQVNFVLPKLIDHPLVKRGNRVTERRAVNVFKVVHADQIDEPLTDWLRAAYAFAE